VRSRRRGARARRATRAKRQPPASAARATLAPRATGPPGLAPRALRTDAERMPKTAAGAVAYQPRFASSSPSESVSSEMPRMACGSPVLSSASTSGRSQFATAWTMAFAMRC